MPVHASDPTVSLLCGDNREDQPDNRWQGVSCKLSEHLCKLTCCLLGLYSCAFHISRLQTLRLMRLSHQVGNRSGEISLLAINKTELRKTCILVTTVVVL